MSARTPVGACADATEAAAISHASGTRDRCFIVRLLRNFEGEVKPMRSARRPPLGPIDAALADRIPDEPLTIGKRRATGLDLQEHDATHGAFFEPVENDVIHRASEEARIAGIERKAG